MTGNDEAISPVIAVMLILVVVVTFQAVYNTTYLPSLKEQAEIEHIGEVETAFLRFAAAMENAASLKRDLQLKESMPLGGGDILLHSMKSGGSLEVTQDDCLFEIACNGTTFPANLVQYSYTPVGNFWEEQGYSWRYGYVNVTRGELATPLQYCSMADVAVASPDFARTFIDFEDEGGSTCEEIHVTVVNLSASNHNGISGNGVGTLELVAATEETTIDVASDSLAIRIAQDLHLSCNGSILAKCKEALEDMDTEYSNVNNYTSTAGPGYDEVSVKLDNATVIVHEVRITVSAY
jgi:hypothetical protein